jgi:hypothetical protein
MIRLGRIVVVLLAPLVLGVGTQPSMAADSCPSTQAALQALIGGGGTVTLSCPTATTIPFTSTITITQDVTLDTSSSPGGITFDGGGSVPFFLVVDSSLTLNGLTLAHGHSADEHDPNASGAIHNVSGTVSIRNSTLSGNSAANVGGAIVNEATLTVSNSTLSGNSAGDGGAIWNFGTASIANSTVANNSARGSGAAIRNNGTASIANSTVANNSAVLDGAIANTGVLSIGGSVVAANSVANCANPGMNGIIDDKGYNLEDDPGASCGLSPGSHDIVGQSPKLAPLADNGGPTQTMALLAGSPAIDQIPTATGLCPPTDQRGSPRPDANETVCDIGAYEFQDGPCPDDETALQDMIGSGGTVTFGCPVPTTVRFTRAITITQDVTLDGSRSPERITFDGGGSVQLFVNFAALTLKGVTLAHGHSNSGGAIYNEGSGTLTIGNSTLAGNSATGSGGAIWNDGTLTITASTLAGNSAADSGGAIDTSASGRMTITNSTLAGNSATDGGAIENDNTASIANSTFAGNSAAEEGGAVSNTGALSVAGTILAASSGDNCANFGSIDDRGYNLEDDPGASCGFAPTSHDIVGQSPKLGPLANNGGPTQTMALLAGSPAIDQIPTASGLCPATDQRGAQRPDGIESACDIGAFESDGTERLGAGPRHVCPHPPAGRHRRHHPPTQRRPGRGRPADRPCSR